MTRCCKMCDFYDQEAAMETDVLAHLMKQAKSLSQAEDILLMRLQKVIRLKSDVDEEIDKLQKRMGL